MSITPIKLNDPPYFEEQELYGVKDKQAYIKDASLNTKTVERRSSKCMTCEDRKTAKKAIFGNCVGKTDIECNCCEECRKDCYLIK